MKNQADNSLENKIRIAIESSRIRLNEFFIDYDKLRSGYVTKTQFERVLNQALKLLLTEDDVSYLSKKYDHKDDSTVNYRAFIQVVNKIVPERDLKEDPKDNVFKNPQYLGTFRSMKTLNPNEESILKSLLNDLKSYYSKRNIDILTSFRDFDRNNIGVLTDSQFRRSMTEPTLTDADLELLIRKYQHPDKKTSVNYLNFYNDLQTCKEETQPVENFSSTFYKNQQDAGLSVQEIIDKISIACHKNGIRLIDFFKDYDRLKCGLITDRQFISSLTVSVKKEANLASEEINQLAEYFRKSDGRIDFKTFCDTIENVFNIPDMDKKPLSNVLRPPRGLLSKTLNGNLNQDEEEEATRSLETIANKVKKYKIQIFPFFKDYDRSTAFTRNVTKIQFGRVLSTLNLMPSVTEFEIICKKFEDPVTGDINYPMFCQLVDEEFVSSKIEELKVNDDFKSLPSVSLNSTLPVDISKVDLNELVARIRSTVLGNRIRIKEFFQDMDPLNSGNVTKSQFIRCLSSIGVSSLGSFNINKAQTEALCKEYQVSNDTNKISWKKFEQDVESVFTLRELEKNPNARVAPTQTFVMPPPGTVGWEDENLNSSENYKQIIDKLQLVVKQRRLDCWPPFRDYDRLNRGHVTSKQFYQSLTKIGLQPLEKDVAILEARFLNQVGFNYVEFLKLLQPNKVEEAKYLKLREELDILNSQKPIYEAKPLNDVQSILLKIKDQVFRKRVSIYEWLRDHDKLNSGRLLRDTFKRAIDLCNLEIESSEIELIMNYYSSAKDNRMVEYKDFCFEIETAFANSQLEKNPLLAHDQHVARNPIEFNLLTPDEEDIAFASLRTIAERVRAQRIQLFPRFEDFDQVKNGFVTQNQFRRVLNDLKLGSLLNVTELDAVIKKYLTKIGTRDDVNYIAFSDKIYELGSFEYRKP